jgi:GNAT superfamily N-acetyltransferase
MASIRVAQVQDAAAISHVHVQSWLSTYRGILPTQYLASLNEADRVPQWQDWLTRDITVFVAEIDGEIVGFAGGGPIREPLASCDAELYSIYLLQEAQGRGIGKALVSAVAGQLVEMGYQSMLVWVLEQNPALCFYQKMGAQHLMKKEIEIGGLSLPELALGWPDLRSCLSSTNPISPDRFPGTALPSLPSTRTDL